MEVRIRPATKDDVDGIRQLLIMDRLPTELIVEHIENFVVASNRVVCGCAGFESYKPAALFRSLSVEKNLRGHDIGRKLIAALLQHARAAGIEQVFALTTTAEPYLRRLGFRQIERAQLPEAILQSPQCLGLCPASAITMMYGPEESESII